MFPMKILIVGGGIGGPALASFLDNDDRFDITLVEQAPEFKNIGYGISLWPNGQKMVDMLGLRHLIDQKGYVLPWLGVENRKGKYINEIFFSVFSQFGTTVTLPRATLHGGIIERLKKGKTKIKLGTKFSSFVEKNEKIFAKFEDGTEEEYDLIVGADGVRSKVKESAFGKDFIRLYGWSAWVFWVEGITEYSRGVVEVPEHGGICFVYPTLDKCFAMIGTNSLHKFTTPEEKLAELRKISQTYPASIQKIVDTIPSGENVFYDELRYVDMPKWYKGRAVIIGDAKHAASPLSGMGASMALEDAYVLADELKKNYTSAYPKIAFQKFVERRDKRMKKFRKLCHRSEGWVMASGFKLWIREFVYRVIPMSYFTKPISRLLSSEL